MDKQNINKGEIVIYVSQDGSVQTDVTLHEESLWLSLNQLADLFGRDKSVISRHIKNIYSQKELTQNTTVAFFATVQVEGNRTVERNIECYNLDMILSVGYRVNSKQGTQFRIWANRILKDHLVKGFTINEKRLKEKTEEIATLKAAIALIERSILKKTQHIDEAKELVKLLSDFSKGLSILDDYDHKKLDSQGITNKESIIIEPEEFLTVVNQMKSQFDSELFGRQKDDSFLSSVRQIYQSFGGNELYPSIEEKAAMLLYFVVKNHSFIDGNKRIAAALFLYFLNRNNLLYFSEQKTVINGDALASLTLLIAESKPEEKETVKKVIISILNRGRS